MRYEDQADCGPSIHNSGLGIAAAQKQAAFAHSAINRTPSSRRLGELRPLAELAESANSRLRNALSRFVNGDHPTTTAGYGEEQCDTVPQDSPDNNLCRIRGALEHMDKLLVELEGIL